MKSCNSKNKSNTCQKIDSTIAEFQHKAPEGYSYEFEEFKRGVVAIWLRCHRKFDYNNGAATRTIWGFYDTKKQQYFSPINSKTIGACVNIKETRNYTAMPIKYQGIESFFV